MRIPDPVLTPLAHQRREGLLDRTLQGVKNGTLDRSDVESLRASAEQVRGLREELAADGAVDRDERRQLHAAIGDVSREIHDLKQDHRYDATPLARRRALLLAARVEAGVRDGSIDSAELAGLQAQAGEVQALRAELAADGKVERGERGQLQRALSELSRQIHAVRHDDDAPQGDVVDLDRVT